MMAENRIEHAVTFDEYWHTQPFGWAACDARTLTEKVWNDAHAAGKLESAQHILALWEEPWPVSQMSFISRLRAYVASCKDDVGTT